MIERVERDDGRVGVRFRLSKVGVPALRVCVLGEFNDWTPRVDPMIGDDEGFVLEIPLERGRSYRFRYLVDYELTSQHWENDPYADRYEANGFGSDDGVIDLTADA